MTGASGRRVRQSVPKFFIFRTYTEDIVRLRQHGMFFLYVVFSPVGRESGIQRVRNPAFA